MRLSWKAGVNLVTLNIEQLGRELHEVMKKIKSLKKKAKELRISFLESLVKAKEKKGRRENGQYY